MYYRTEFWRENAAPVDPLFPVNSIVVCKEYIIVELYRSFPIALFPVNSTNAYEEHFSTVELYIRSAPPVTVGL